MKRVVAEVESNVEKVAQSDSVVPPPKKPLQERPRKVSELKK